MPRVRLTVAAATLAAACALTAPVTGHAAAACGFGGYSYAGLMSDQSRFGVGATITPLTVPTVEGGHVAAWVGVGGQGEGPNGSDEWLQVGISAEQSNGVALYYELALPGVAPRYVMLKGHLQPDRSYRVAVLEARNTPGWWRVWVNGSSVTRRIHLPGSHGVWRPVVTTESWDGGIGACNAFAFRFAHVSVAAAPGGAWSPMRSSVIDAPGFAVQRRSSTSFVATAGPVAG
jgi:hypothetical protein